ncbi:carbohydrate ABC transporter permease [Saccharibacillus sp. JS10]|uniref:carbohydrate ABC transporter permease n=1 Tax=Saccharibacillus sp. JS10 TaxID=2950552 RepID=UPI00210A89FA|nr:sugar ABC transporter permease [Saccharibacillus sp. JS10]MCQ4087470.1 sugar ABC transporter permease [Saccharibacillus sp. JS10]
MNIKRLKHKRALWLFLLPGTLLYLFLFAYPTLSGLFYSFTDWDGVSDSYRMIGLDNYKDSFESLVFRKTLLNNVKFMLSVVIVQTIVSLVLAMLLSRNTKTRVFLRALFFLPAILSSVSVGLIWSFVYDPTIGMLNLGLRGVGLDSLTQNWIGDRHIALYAIAAVQVWAHAGQMMIVFIAGLQAIPSELYESARIDGGSRMQLFRHITWPLLAPASAIVIAYTTIQSFKAFDLIFVMTDGGPNNATEILSTYIYHTAFGNYQFGLASAGSMIFLVVLAVLTYLQFKALRTDRAA